MKVAATKLWDNGVLVTVPCRIFIDCDSFVAGTPKPAFLVPRGCCGTVPTGYDMASAVKDDAENVLTGAFVQFKNGSSVILDVSAISDITAACQSCCDPVAIDIPAKYDGNFPWEEQPCVPVIYWFTREDNGDYYAFSKALQDYAAYYISDSFQRASYDGAISTYQFASCVAPVFADTDTMLPFIVFSNTGDDLGPGQTLLFVMLINGGQIGDGITGGTYEELLSNINADADYAAQGTWSLDGNRVRLETYHPDQYELQLSVEGSPTYVSNHAPVLVTGEQFEFTLSSNGVSLSPKLNGDTLQTIATAANNSATYNTYGSYDVVDDTIVLSANAVANYVLTLAKRVLTIPSNSAPALQTGQAYRMMGVVAGISLPDIEDGNTLNSLLTAILANSTWNSKGTWGIAGNTITLTTTLISPIVSLIISTRTVTVQSNALVLQGGEQFKVDATFVGSPLPTLNDGNSYYTLLDVIQADPTWSIKGNWGTSGSNIQVTTTFITPSPTLVVGKQSQGFNSNAAPALVAGEQYAINATVVGGALPPISGNPDLNELLYDINNNVDWNSKGTWALNGNVLSLTTTLIIPAATIVISKEQGNFSSNDAPVLTGGNVYQIDATIAGSALTPIKGPLTLPDLLTAIQADVTWSGKGTWSINGQKIDLLTTLVSPAPAIVVTEVAP